MLKKRIIPVILYNRDLQVVKPTQFKRPGRTVGSLEQTVRHMNSRNVDELILIDIDATLDGRTLPFEKIKKFTSELFCPVTLGGGIRTVSHIREALNSGADKVAICSGWYDNHHFIADAARVFGSQAIVACVNSNVEGGPVGTYQNRYRFSPKYDAIYLYEHGAGEILYTSVEREGTMSGYDLETINEISTRIRIPLIANGGCGTAAHMIQAFEHGADAVAASSVFLFTDTTPKGMARQLLVSGVPARVE